MMTKIPMPQHVGELLREMYVDGDVGRAKWSPHEVLDSWARTGKLRYADLPDGESCCSTTRVATNAMSCMRCPTGAQIQSRFSQLGKDPVTQEQVREQQALWLDNRCSPSTDEC